MNDLVFNTYVYNNTKKKFQHVWLLSWPESILNLWNLIRLRIDPEKVTPPGIEPGLDVPKRVFMWRHIKPI